MNVVNEPRRKSLNWLPVLLRYPGAGALYGITVALEEAAEPPKVPTWPN